MQLKGKHVMLLVTDEEIYMKDKELRIIDQITSQPHKEDQLSILWIAIYSSLSKEQTDYHFKTQKKAHEVVHVTPTFSGFTKASRVHKSKMAISKQDYDIGDA